MYHEEMEIGCTARGARPAAVIEWSLPSTEEFDFEVEEEVNLVGSRISIVKPPIYSPNGVTPWNWNKKFDIFILT